MKVANRGADLSASALWAALTLILLVGLAARILHWQLTVGSDDQRWVIVAGQLGGEHDPDIKPVYYARIVWRVVLAGWGAAFGLRLETTAVLMLLLGGATAVLVALAARSIFGPAAGVLAAAVYYLHPLNVVMDPVTLPDGLGVALVAGCLFAHLCWLKRGGGIGLCVAGCLAGAAFGVKSYYILVSVPLAVSLLWTDRSWRTKCFDTCAFAACVLAGLSIDQGLHLWESGNPMAHLTALSDVGERTLAHTHTDRTGAALLVNLLAQRAMYLDWLFFEFGVTGGFVLLCGLLYLVLRSEQRLACWTVLGVMLVLAAFIGLTPATLRPLRFVEMQVRYLTVLLPALAIGAGAALASALTCCKSRAVRRALLAGLIVSFGHNLWLPNDLTRETLPRFRALEFAGLRQEIDSAGEAGIAELLLPGDYDQRLPDSFYEQGVRLTCVPDLDELSVDDLCEYLEAAPGRALFVPRPLYTASRLKEAYDFGRPGGEPGRSQQIRTLAAQLEGCGFAVHEVRVPYTSLRTWAQRFGYNTAGKLVGWVVRAAE